MANYKHLEVLSQGVANWNNWREGQPSTRPDLSGADLSGQKLERIDFRLAKLDNIALEGTNLYKSDLSGSSMRSARLTRANLGKTDLHRADLFRAIAVEANLHRSNMRGTVLREANLKRSNLKGAYFDPAILNQADLSDTLLHRSTFVGARMIGANFSGARLWETVISDCDLTDAVGLEQCEHDGPSTIDLRTIARSEKISDVFLKGCGLPDRFIDYLPSLTTNQPILHYSCFISYSHADNKFAQKLFEYLQQAGVRCWLDEHQLLPGDDLFDQIDRGIRLWDKVLLCCSEASLSSWWVDNEIDLAFAKERDLMMERRTKVLSLIPLNIDGYVFSENWKSGKKQQVLSRLAADFTGWENGWKEFESQANKVLIALRADNMAREAPPIQRL